MMYGFPQKPVPKRVVERFSVVPGNSVYLFQQFADLDYDVIAHTVTNGVTARAYLPIVHSHTRRLQYPDEITVTATGTSVPTASIPSMFDGLDSTSVSWVLIGDGAQYYVFDFGSPIILDEVRFHITGASGTCLNRLYIHASANSPTDWAIALYGNIDIPLGFAHYVFYMSPTQPIRYVRVNAYRGSASGTMLIHEAVFTTQQGRNMARGIRYSGSAQSLIVEYTPVGA